MDRVSWAFVAFISGTGMVIEQRGSGKITNAEVQDAEAYKTLAALEVIINNKRDRSRSAIYFLLDNSAAVQALLMRTTGSSSWWIQKFCQMVAKVAAPVQIGWIPGHKGLAGNQISDELARRELNSLDNSRTIYAVLTSSHLDGKLANWLGKC